MKPIGILLWWGVVAALVSALPAAAPVPLTYNAITDEAARPEPPLPKMGPAGTIIVDPTFGSRLLLVSAHPPEAPRAAAFILGADISWVQQKEEEGTHYSDAGGRKDILDILKDHKFKLADLAQWYKQPIVLVEYSTPDVRQINDIVRNLPNGKGLGTFIWEPTSGPLFDAKGAAKPEIDAYPEMAKDYGGK